MDSAFSYLNFINFSNISRWDVKRFNLESEFVNESWVCLNKILEPYKKTLLKQELIDNKIQIISKINFAGNLFLRPLTDIKDFKSTLFEIPAECLIYSKINVRHGCTYFNKTGRTIAGTSEYPVFKIKKDLVDGEYLQKILRTNYIKKYLSSKTTGFSKTRVQIEEFLNTKIPLPSLSKQREIVEKYNAKIKLAEQQEQKAKNLEKEIDLYLNDALGIKEGIKVNFNKQIKNIRFIPFKNLSRWDSFFFNNEFKVIDNCLAQAKYECKKVDQVVEKLINGVDSRQYIKKGVPYLRVSNIKPNKIEISDIKYIENCNKNTKGFVKKNEILITRKGTYGNAVVVTEEDEKHNFVVSSEVFKLTLKDADIINPYYFQYYINSSFCKLQMERVKTRGIMGSLTQEALLNLIIPLPPICVQNDIVLNIEKKQKNITTLLVQFEQNKIDAQQEFEKELFE